ncbi:hypothetical protein AB0N05_33890 [Nocardia sp. NPDC051030]|uniref:hypothetical protein n=1 Tax=Nocardia sp. NPDC051030 TaxID=3155162 RepID=UPI003444FA53
MATSVSDRISRLRALIDHPRTGDAERAAAQRMLERALGKSAQPGPVGDRTYGDRYDRVGRHASLPRIADMIGEDIALARIFTIPEPGDLAEASAVRDAPASITYTVETPYDGSILITIDGVPKDWGWVSEHGIETVSPALEHLTAQLDDIMNAYNRDGTDIARRFFGQVRIQGAAASSN